MDIKMKRGQILKDLRKNYKDSKLNQADVANIIGVSVQAYQKYEYGTAEPTFDAISKLADFYNVSVDYLLGRETKIKDPIETMMNQLHLNLHERAIVSAYLAMDTKSRSDLVKMVQNVAQNIADATKSGTESKRCTYTVQVAARGGDQPHTVEITPEEKERIANLPRVPDDL